MLSAKLDQMMQQDFAPNLVGTWRRFGMLGPIYEIIGPGQTFTKGERTMRVRVV